MYAIHTTPGFIIDSRPRGEAGKLLSIFTRDFGLIMASAQGIRLEKSKLRYYVQEYSFGTYSLVRGKEFWRLTSAADVSPTFKSDDERRHFSTYTNTIIARLAILLRRLLQGEEPHPELFDIVHSGAAFIHDNKDLSPEQLQTLESVIVLRMMRALGYIGDGDVVGSYASDAELTLDLLTRASAERSAINQHINKALKESHL